MNVMLDKASKVLTVQAEPGLTEESFTVLPYTNGSFVECEQLFYTLEDTDTFGFTGIDLFSAVDTIVGNKITFLGNYPFFKESLGTYLYNGNKLSLIVAATDNSLSLKDNIEGATKAQFKGFIPNIYFIKFNKVIDYVEIYNLTTGELGNSLFAVPQVDIVLTRITNVLDQLNADFDTLKADHVALGGTLATLGNTLSTVSTKIDDLSSSFESANYLTATDIRPLFDTQYDERLF